MDVQGFQLCREFIIKEIALVGAEGKIYHVWTLKPPCRFEHLSIDDRVAVKRTSNFKLGLAWDDGDVPYRSVSTIFVQIAREFRTWIVEDKRAANLVFEYKSLSVKIREISEIIRVPEDGSDPDQDIVYPSLCCLHDHPCCAVQKATRLFNLYLNFQKNPLSNNFTE